MDLKWIGYKKSHHYEKGQPFPEPGGAGVRRLINFHSLLGDNLIVQSDNDRAGNSSPVNQ